MKKQYKDLFDNINPDNELFLSLLSTEKTYVNKKHFIALAACLMICSVVLLYHFTMLSKEENNIIIPIAYETKKQNESQKHIKRYIQNNNKNIIIDADVIVEANKKNMKIYDVSIKDFSEDLLEEILYSENGFYYGDKNHSAIFETILGGTTFNISPEIKQNVKIQSKGNNYAEGCSYSYSEAKNIAEKFVQIINLQNYKFKEGKIEKANSAFYGNWRSGYYIFNYIQYADGFSIETVSSDIESSVASDLTIKIDNEGIVGLNMFGLDLKEKTSLNGNIISVETAIDFIEKNINKIWLSEFAPIVEIRLEYILVKDNNKNLILVPCWHFCINQAELKMLDITTQRENDTNDICVNAVTGELYRVADRYPVFQTNDGLIVTWKG